jgi:hypothetical protein
MVQVQERAGWAEAVEGLHERLVPHFVRAEPRQRVCAYMEDCSGVRSGGMAGT